MKIQNQAASRIVQTLDSLGYNVNQIDLKVSGPDSNPYVEASIKISRFGFPACPQNDGLSEQPRQAT